MDVRQRYDAAIEPYTAAEQAILDEVDRSPNAITTQTALSEKMGLFSTGCIIVNRMIGTGIFSTPGTVMKATKSVGMTLVLWALGFLISWAGLMVYIEFGLSIPRYTINGILRPIPRSGGEKNYLEHVYRVPKYLATCVYGVIFIVLGNTAGNGITFAKYTLTASGYPQDQVDGAEFGWRIKGIAIIAISAACILHGTWRSGGIWVNNILSVIKCGILLTIFGAAIAFKIQHGGNGPQNFDTSKSFDGTSTSVSSYAQPMLLVIFAYGGFENANYVLSEIDRPKRTFKWAAMLALGIVSVLYMLALISYFLVLNPEDFADAGSLLVETYFRRIFGKSLPVIPAFIALASFGNIIVVTFVASRVKQEIAKEGVLPWSRVLASDTRTPFSKLRATFRHSSDTSSTVTSTPHHENTPVAALALHWLFSTILIISPPAGEAYNVVLLLHSYMIHVWVGFFLGAGLLYLYFKPGSTWQNERGYAPFGNWFWAAFLTASNAFLICAAWIPSPSGKNGFSFAYWIIPTVGTAIAVLGVVYWAAFRWAWPRWYKHELRVRRVPIVQGDVQICEAVFFNWVIPGADETVEVHTGFEKFPG